MSSVCEPVPNVDLDSCSWLTEVEAHVVSVIVFRLIQDLMSCGF